MSPEDYCQQRAIKSGSTLYYSFLFLPSGQRLAVTALYAFYRELHDIVDKVINESVANNKLSWWRKEIVSMLYEDASHPVTQSLQLHLKTFQLDISDLSKIIDGLEIKLNQNMYLDYSSLKQNCSDMNLVNMLSAKIFGFKNAETLRFAEKVGFAFQLTNIIRFIGEDSRRGRIYIPADELQKFNVTPDDMLNMRYSKDFLKLMSFQVNRVRKIYDEALMLLPKADEKTQEPILIMVAVYRALLIEIERENFCVLHQGISLTPIRKLWLAWKTHLCC